MSNLYIYTVSRDLGFAPNPFHGFCTLATCKPGIRKDASQNDWVMGIGGRALNGNHMKCIYLMRVTEIMSFQEYWDDERFRIKRPVRNGSKVSLLGDNIYYRDKDGNWIQENSHHSNADGTINLNNLGRDTKKTENVLVSEDFYYFGTGAVEIETDLLGIKGGLRGYKKNLLNEGSSSVKFINAMTSKYSSIRNTIAGDPVMFDSAASRVDQITSKMV